MSDGHRLVLLGGDAIDGTGAPRRRADVAVVGDRIVEVGLIEPTEADKVLDVAGLVVAPGFHDVHTHYDLVLLDRPGHLDGLRQGITTYHVGQCGLGFAPASAETQALFREYVAAIATDPALPSWRSVADFLDLFDRTAAVNCVYMLPHGLLRVECAGMTGEPLTPAQADRLRGLVAEGMEQGARGISTGLGYFPGSECATGEIVEAARVVAEHGGIYVSHIRSYMDGLLDAIDEAAAIGRGADIAVHISHLRPSGPYRGHADAVLAHIEGGRDELGVDISFDSYTYLKGCTIMAAIVVPPCVYAGGLEAAIERVRDPDGRRTLAEAMPQADWSEVHISCVGSQANRRFEGMRLPDFAEAVGKPVFDACCDLLVEERFRVGVVGWPILESDLQQVLRHPLCLIGSDGIPAGSARHPRACGSHARYLGHYVRGLGLLPLEEAVRRITSAAARRFGLSGRGILAEGMAADITVFDPDTIIDKATYEHPLVLSEGVHHVLVNGQLVLRDGELTDARPGRALR